MYASYLLTFSCLIGLAIFVYCVVLEFRKIKQKPSTNKQEETNVLGMCHACGEGLVVLTHSTKSNPIYWSGLKIPESIMVEKCVLCGDFPTNLELTNKIDSFYKDNPDLFQYEISEQVRMLDVHSNNLGLGCWNLIDNVKKYLSVLLDKEMHDSSCSCDNFRILSNLCRSLLINNNESQLFDLIKWKNSQIIKNDLCSSCVNIEKYVLYLIKLLEFKIYFKEKIRNEKLFDHWS